MDKCKITKSNIDKESRLFNFLCIGSIVYVDDENERVYSEDKEQWVPFGVALKFGVEAEMV